MTKELIGVVDDEDLAQLQFATPFKLVPFAESVKISNPVNQDMSKGRKAMDMSLSQTGAHSHEPAQSPSSRSSSIVSDSSDCGQHIGPPFRSEVEMSASSQVASPKDAEDAAAANWGSHLWIRIGTGSDSTVLEIGHESAPAKAQPFDDAEPIYTGLKE